MGMGKKPFFRAPGSGTYRRLSAAEAKEKQLGLLDQSHTPRTPLLTPLSPSPYSPDSLFGAALGNTRARAGRGPAA